MEDPQITSDEHWEDCLGDFKAEFEKMGPLDVQLHPILDQNTAISAPHILEPMTDTGYGWKNFVSLEQLKKEHKVPNPATLSDEEIISLMDRVFIDETRVLQGWGLSQALLQCIYFHDLTMAEPNQAVSAFLRSTIKCFGLVFSVVRIADVRDPEDFTQVSEGLNTLEGVDISTVMGELDAAIVASSNEEIKKRLQLRKLYLGMLRDFSVYNKTHVVNACAQAAQAAKLVKQCVRDGEPQDQPNIFTRETESWLPLAIPVSPPPELKYSEAQLIQEKMFDDYASIAPFVLAQFSLFALFTALDTWSNREALLSVRSRFSLLFFGNNEEPCLFGPSVVDRILNYLEIECGAPLFKKLIKGNSEALINEVAAFKNAKNSSNMSLAETGHHIMSEFSTWLSGVAKEVMSYMNAALWNIGRFHRRVLRLLRNINTTLDGAAYLDTNNFCVLFAPESLQHRTEILSTFSLQFTFHMLRTILTLTSKLNLITPAELIPFCACQSMLNARCVDMESLIHILHPNEIPQQHVHKKTGVPLVCPALASRVATTVDQQRQSLVLYSRLFSDASYLLLSVLKIKKVLSLPFPEASLISVEETFNHRFMIFARCRGLHFYGYEAMMAKYKELSEDPNWGLVSKLEEVERTLRQLLNAMKPALARENSTYFPIFSALEKACKANVVACMLIGKTANGEKGADGVLEEFTVDWSTEFDPSFIVVKVKGRK